MRNCITGLFFLLSLGLGACLPRETAPPQPKGWHTSNGYIRDPHGRAVVLRGVNVDNSSKRPPDFIGWQTEREYDLLQEWGFNVIRLLIFWEAIEPQPNVYDSAFLDRISERVRWAKERNIHVVLDMHQDLYGRGFGNNGAPAWSCPESHYQAYQPVTPWFMNYANPQIMACYDQFWRSETLRGHLLRVWEQVALRFAQEDGVIGFDFYNEPYQGSMAIDVYDREYLQVYYYQVIDTMIPHLSGKLFFLEPVTLTQSGALPLYFDKPFRRANGVFSPHYYERTTHDPGLVYTGKQEDIEKVFQVYDNMAQGLGTPMWLGEYGGITINQGFLTYLEHLTRVMEKRTMGSTYYDMGNTDQGFGLLHSDKTPKEEVLNVSNFRIS